MPSEVQNGTAVIHGIKNDGSSITITGYASFLLESGKAQHKFKLDNVEDEVGFDASLIATNGFVELDIMWTPSGASKAAALATAVFLEPLAMVTLDNFAVTTFNGDYVYIGDGSIDLSHKVAKLGLKLRKYDDEDQNASLTTEAT